jgi:peptide deformylase
MTRTILKGDKARIKCRSVFAFDDNLRRLIRDLKHTLLVHDGAGLAAPQIGVGLRVFVYLQAPNQIGAMCNPEILERHGTVEHPHEGCLSMPNYQRPMERAEWIVIRAQSPAGHGYTVKLTGKPAWVVQHEVDHLDGKTIYP